MYPLAMTLLKRLIVKKGCSPRTGRDENHQDASEEALAHNDPELISAFSGKISKNDVQYLEDLIRPELFNMPKLGHLVAAKTSSFT